MIKKIFSIVLLLTFLVPTTVYADTTSKTETYDIVVIGGEPEGIAAAVSAARNGSKVLLIDSRTKLGGLLTVSEMNIVDIARNSKGEETSQGIFKEFHKMIGYAYTANITNSVDAFNTLVKNEPNITLKLSTTVTKANVVNNKFTGGQYINSIVIVEKGVGKTVFAKNYIDATADADFSTLVGVPYTYGNEDIGKPDSKMAVTLMMHFKNVNWQKMVNYVNTTKIASVYNDTAWGFWDFVESYEEKEPNTNLRGLNVGRDTNGDVYINALQIFNVDGVNPTEKANAIQVGKRETVNVLNWLKVNLPGFENATIAGYPAELYVRETRHIEPLYKLSIADVFENKDQWDKIAFGGYPVDMQATDKTQPNLIVVNPDQYAIPFRSIVPVNVRNLLVTSKASGYESLAAGSVRVIPTGMAVAEAGGLAASLAIKADVDFHTMSTDTELITTLQNTLRKNGAYLPVTSNLSFPYQNADYYEDMKELYTRGLLYLDYTNNLHENDLVTFNTFYQDMLQILPEGTERDAFIRNSTKSTANINLNYIRNTMTYMYGPNTSTLFKIPSGNGTLTVKDFVVIKANLVRYLDKASE